MYPDSFISQVPPSSTAFIIDGMFIINTIPLAVHKTFSDYICFLFDKWVSRPQKQFQATEIHLVFDDPNRHGLSPKDLERSRRDQRAQVYEYDVILEETDLPSNWRMFLLVRKQKIIGQFYFRAVS